MTTKNKQRSTRKPPVTPPPALDSTTTPGTASPEPAVTPEPASMATTPAAGPKPNVKYIGRVRWDKGKRKRLDRNEPIEQFSDRGAIVELPSAATQERKRLFYHEQAGAIVNAFPHLYKPVIR